MSQMARARRAYLASNRLSQFMALPWVILVVTAASGQTDTTAPTGAPASNLATVDARSAGSLALFAGVQQGLHTEQGEQPQQADWLLGAAPNIALGRSWEFSPEIVLWHLTSDTRVQVAPPFPTGAKVIGEKSKWYLKLGLPFRWFPVTSDRFSAYALSGPSCLIWRGAVVTLEVGAGLGWELSHLLTLTGEVRTYLYYHTSESVVLGSPVSLLVGVRLRQGK